MLDHGDPWAVLLEELPGLVDGHVVCPDLPDVLYPLTRKRHQILFDADVHLTFDPERIGPEKFEVGNESSGDGVLDRHHCSICRAILHRLEKRLEGGAFDNPDVLSHFRIELSRGLFVETTAISLNRNLLHSVKFVR